MYRLMFGGAWRPTPTASPVRKPRPGRWTR
nr:hypothetical protein [Arthrobacter nitrophenolicus]